MFKLLIVSLLLTLLLINTMFENPNFCKKIDRYNNEYILEDFTKSQLRVMNDTCSYIEKINKEI